MAIRRVITTHAGDGNSVPFQVDLEEAPGGQAEVGYSITGTWSSVTAKLQQCANPDASPQVWADVTSASYTANASDSWSIPAGSWFRINVSGSGSPLPNLTSVVTGYIDTP